MQVCQDWLLTPHYAAIHVPSATAVIADVHLGYHHARIRAGEAVPSKPISETIDRLAPLVTGYNVQRLVIAGDLFESGPCETDLNELLDWLRGVRVEVAGVVPGNHDRAIDGLASRLPLHPNGIALGSWQVVHGDRRLPRVPLVQGHLHPCIRWRRASAPCFLVTPRRLILPAFSAEAAGVNVWRDRRWRGFSCYAIAGGELLAFGKLRRGEEVKRRRLFSLFSLQ